MAKSSNNKSIEDLENQLLLKNKNLNEKYLEIETLLDLTNTINSVDDLESLFFNVLTLSSSIINSSKGVILIKNEVSNIFDVFSEFNLEDTQLKKQIFNTRSGILKKLNKEKIFPSHYDMRFVKPIDQELLHKILKKYKFILTVEDGCVMGGFGSAVLEFMAENNYTNSVQRLGIPDRIVEHGSQDELYSECYYDDEAIYDFCNKMLDHQGSKYEELVI